MNYEIMVLLDDAFSWGSISVIGLLIAALIFFVVRLIGTYDKQTIEIQELKDAHIVEMAMIKDKINKMELDNERKLSQIERDWLKELGEVNVKLEKFNNLIKR